MSWDSTAPRETPRKCSTGIWLVADWFSVRHVGFGPGDEKDPSPSSLQVYDYIGPEYSTESWGHVKEKKGRQDDVTAHGLPSEWVATSHCYPFPVPPGQV